MFLKYQSSAVSIQNLLQGNASFTLIDDILTKVFDLVVASLTCYSAFYTAYMVFFMLCRAAGVDLCGPSCLRLFCHLQTNCIE